MIVIRVCVKNILQEIIDEHFILLNAAHMSTNKFKICKLVINLITKKIYLIIS